MSVKYIIWHKDGLTYMAVDNGRNPDGTVSVSNPAAVVFKVEPRIDPETKQPKTHLVMDVIPWMPGVAVAGGKGKWSIETGDIMHSEPDAALVKAYEDEIAKYSRARKDD